MPRIGLEKNKYKYRLIFENIQDVYYEVTLDGRILEISPSVEHLCQYSRQELIGKSLYTLYQDPGLRESLVEEILMQGRVSNYEICLRDKDHRLIYCLINARLLVDDQDNPVKIVGSLQDITERKRIEEASRERERWLQALLAASPVGIALTQNRILQWANASLYRILGYEEGALVGRPVRILYPDVEEFERVGGHLFAMIEAKGMGMMETRLLSRDNRIVQAYLQASPIDASDLSQGIIVAIMDISEIKQAREHIHALTSQLIQAQERERQMIAHELHDRIGQDLSFLKITCDTLFDTDAPSNPELRGKIKQLSAKLQELIGSIRNMAYELRPTGLERLGLLQTLKNYCGDFTREHGIRVDFFCTGLEGVHFDKNMAINIYRIVQEALFNIKKHSRASQARIKLIGSYPQLFLRITDNGCGFKPEQELSRVVGDKKMGLSSMQGRASMLGGTMNILSDASRGTRIVVKLPFPETNNDPSNEHSPN